MAKAQPAPSPLSTDKALTQFVLNTYGRDEGLPQITANAIAQTPDGYLWVGTEDGLARFDGLQFEVFEPANTPAFAQNAIIKALHVDHEGALWIGTDGGGLVRYAAGRFSTYGPESGLGGRHIGEVVGDSQGRLWVGTYDAGLYVRERNEFRPVQEAGLLAGRRITALVSGPDGQLWIGTDAGLFRHDAQTREMTAVTEGLTDPFVTALAVGAEGRVWVSTRAGTGVLVDGRYQPAGPAASLSAFALLPDAAGTLWIGADGAGVARLVGDRLLQLGMAEGLPHDRVRVLFTDREGSLWIGTEAGGLAQLREGLFTPVTTHQGLAGDMVMTVFEDAQGALWAGTDGAGVTRLHGGNATTYRAADGLGSDVVLSLGADAEGGVWVGTYGGGVHRFKNGRFQTHNRGTGFLSDAVFALHLGRSGRLWMGTDSGVSGYRDGAFTSITEQNGLSSNAVASLYEDHAGDLWVGTMHGELNRVRAGVVQRFGPADGLAGGIVTSFVEDAAGALWVGTYGGGLVRYRDDAFEAVTVREGLPTNNILALLRDGDTLWATTNKGPFRVLLADLDAVVEGRADSVPVRLFDRHDGLLTTEMNGGVQPAGWKGRDGTLWFPTVAGLAGIRPAASAPAPLPLVQLQVVTVDGEAAAATDALHLKPGRKKIEFTFVAPTFVAPGDVTYRYRLEGYEEDWTVTSNRTATYTNLPPGVYTFQVQARTREGGWSTPAAATFDLAPYFYQTWWFWPLFVIMAGLAFAAAAAGVHRARVAALQARQRELEAVVAARTQDLQAANDQIEAQNAKLIELDRFKTSFFANISHEFRTPLTLIVGPLENALGGAYGPLAGSMQKQMEIMLRNALRLLRLINQLLDLSKLEDSKMNLRARPCDLVAFLDGVVAAFTTFAEHKRIDLRFQSEADAVELYFEPDKLEKVFFNLLSNAVKFTPQDGTITLALTEQAATPEMPEGGIEVRVRDTGHGIPSADLPFIFDRFRQVDSTDTRLHEGTGIGLALVRELVLLHGGAIDVHSEVGGGTEFVVTLRKGSAHLQEDALVDEPEDRPALETPQHGAMIELAAGAFNTMTPADAAPADAAPAAAPLVLVVDDNQDVLSYVAACLDPRYRVATARDGAEGLETARALRPDLVVADIMMPRMSGHELCRALKADPHLQHTPIILLSAKTSQETIIESIESGADDYLAKPFNAREMLARIDNLLTLRAHQKALKQLNDELEARVEEQLQTILREREAYEAQLVSEKERAEEAARLKAAILDNMSHEFRTPLTAILGYSEILLEEAGEDAREFAEAVHTNGDRLMRTLNAVLEMSALEASAADSTVRQPVNVAAVAAEVVRTRRSDAEAKGLPLALHTGEESVMAFTNDDAVARILGILVDNAVKFTPAGTVDVTVEGGPDAVTVHVRDTGIGIGPAFLPKLFAPFEQESLGNTRAFEGNGLNLSIARRLTDLVGGDLTVETVQGEGSTFSLRLPAPIGQVSGDGAVRAAELA